VQKKKRDEIAKVKHIFSRFSWFELILKQGMMHLFDVILPARIFV
jgi:hypothetical protein